MFCVVHSLAATLFTFPEPLCGNRSPEGANIASWRQSARGRYHPVFVENADFADDRDETFNKIG